MPLQPISAEEINVCQADEVIGKEYFGLWKRDVTGAADSVEATLEKFVLKPVAELRDGDFAALKVKIQERKNILTDFDARKWKLMDLHKKEKTDSEKIDVRRSKILH